MKSVKRKETHIIVTVKKKARNRNVYRKEGWRVSGRKAWSGDKEETQTRKMKYKNTGCHN